MNVSSPCLYAVDTCILLQGYSYSLQSEILLHISSDIYNIEKAFKIKAVNLKKNQYFLPSALQELPKVTFELDLK